MNQQSLQEQRTALVVATMNSAFDFCLGANTPGQPVFGNFQAKLGYDAMQLDGIWVREDCYLNVELAIVCQTVINGDWYATIDVCAFAQRALTRVLGNDLPGDTSDVFMVDPKARKVSCSIRYNSKDANPGWLLYLGHRLLEIYTTDFVNTVDRIHPPAASGEPERIPLPKEEEGDGAMCPET